MGILDDAIREHIDLKRKHGAADTEVEKLEKEAFGPPSRPGEPEFSESEDWQERPSDDAEQRQADAARAAEAEAPTRIESSLASDEVDPFEDSDDDPFADLDDGAEPEDDQADEPDSREEPAVGHSSTEQGREDYPELEETMFHDAVESDSAAEPEEPEPEPADPDPNEDFGGDLAEPQVVEIEGTAEEEPISGDDDLDIGDIDLSLDPEEATGEQLIDPLDAPGGPETDPPVVAGEPRTDDYTEAPEAEPAEDTGPDQSRGHDAPVEPPSQEHRTQENEGIGDLFDHSDEPFADEKESSEPEGEDLLEETPDFLRDAPDSDALWFEQNPPQDFDFEDD